MARNRPSYAQLEGLVEFLEQNPGIAKGLLRTTQAKLETKRKWANLATTLNSLGGAHKDGQGWAKYWAEKKCSIKKNCAQLSASMRRTGGGIADNLPELSALDRRLVAVMGGHDFATGDSSLSVNPFPESSGPTELPIIIEVETTQPEDVNMDNVQMFSIPGTPQDNVIQESTTIPEAPTTPVPITIPQVRRRRSAARPLDASMERLARIEERRVEAELTTAKAFAQLSENIGCIASAIQPMALALNAIAEAIKDNKNSD